MPWVQLEVGLGRGQPGRLVSQQGTRILLGRATDCRIRIHDDLVSRHHCEIRYVRGQWIAKDVGSSNGTYLNRRRIREADVRPGDILRLGDGGPKVHIIGLDPLPDGVDTDDDLQATRYLRTAPPKGRKGAPKKPPKAPAYEVTVEGEEAPAPETRPVDIRHEPAAQPAVEYEPRVEPEPPPRPEPVRRAKPKPAPAQRPARAAPTQSAPRPPRRQAPAASSADEVPAWKKGPWGFVVGAAFGVSILALEWVPKGILAEVIAGPIYFPGKAIAEFKINLGPDVFKVFSYIYFGLWYGFLGHFIQKLPRTWPALLILGGAHAAGYLLLFG